MPLSRRRSRANGKEELIATDRRRLDRWRHRAIYLYQAISSGRTRRSIRAAPWQGRTARPPAAVVEPPTVGRSRCRNKGR